MKVHDKGNKKVVRSHISNKSKEKIKQQLKNQIKKIQKKLTTKNINRYNSMVLGMHNYYKIATNVNLDFTEISYIVNKIIYNRIKNLQNKTGHKSETYKKFYGKYNFKIIYLLHIAIFPVKGIRTKAPMNFTQDICNYTKEGRDKIHKKQQSVSTYTLKYIMENPIPSESVEYNDNRISLYVGQNGICPISKKFLNVGNMECHHKIPKILGGNDEYKNLILLKTEVHKLIHAIDVETINKYKQLLDLNKIAIKKVNKLRILVGNFEI